MATYKLIGQRWLRKYTASRKNPVGMAADDAQKIADTLCEVPWVRATAKDAVTTYHTESVVYKDEKTGEEVGGLEMNVRIRDELDAALFCAGHDGSTHRAYANAAVYAYAVPPAAQGKSLTSLAVRVTSDNYNSQGCRLHVWTSDDAALPMSCHDVRGEDSSGAVVEDGTTARGAAPRTTKTVKSTDSKGKEVSTDYWYPTTETVTLAPTGGLALKKYLFLAVVLESYSTVRGNWLEGCSYITNNISVALDSDVDGWVDGKTYNLSVDAATSHELAVLRGGIAPSVPTGSCTGARSVAIRADADLLVEADGTQSTARTATGENAASAVNRLYAEFYAANDEPVVATASTQQTGVVFNVTRTTEKHVADDIDIPVSTDVLRIDSRVLVVPCAYPQGFAARTLRVEYSKPSFTTGTSVRVYRFLGYVAALNSAKLKTADLYVGSSSLDDMEYLGDLDLEAEKTEFALDPGASLSGTIVLAAFLNPECVNVCLSTPQGTGATPFMPKITIAE